MVEVCEEPPALRWVQRGEVESLNHAPEFAYVDFSRLVSVHLFKDIVQVPWLVALRLEAVPHHVKEDYSVLVEPGLGKARSDDCNWHRHKEHAAEDHSQCYKLSSEGDGLHVVMW